MNVVFVMVMVLYLHSVIVMVIPGIVPVFAVVILLMMVAVYVEEVVSY
jgi:hypothetical protein